MNYSAFTASEPHTAFTYDALGRTLTATTPVGTTTTSYDRWTTTTIDANGKQKDFVSDARGNLITVKEYLNGQAYATHYTYDSNNFLTTITDAKGNEKTFTYDKLGRKLSETDLHLPTDTTFGTWTYEYDINGNLVSTTNPKSQTIAYSYDELDRILTEDSDQTTETDVSFVYDTAPNGIGLPTSITSSALIKVYEYDSLGRTTKEIRTIDGTPYTTETTYDLIGNPLEIIYPDAKNTIVIYGYNNANQAETVQYSQNGENPENLVTNLDYAPLGTPTIIEYANGVTTTQTYDINQLYRMTEKETVNGTGTKLQKISYTFDPVGNITHILDTSETNSAKTATYTYDDLDRLLSATITNTANTEDYTRTYAYDILGNITNKSDVGSYLYAGGETATAQGVHSNPHAVTQAGSQTFAYDDDGNLTEDGTWTHTWDAKDRLLASASSNATVSYTYDEGVTRVKKYNETTGKETLYVSHLLDIEAGKEKAFVSVNGLKLATLESSTGTNQTTTCTIPQTGEWRLTENCTIATFETAPQSVTVPHNVTLTITPTGTLEVDLNTYSITIENGGGIHIQTGGSLAQTGKLTPPQNGEEPEKKLIYHHTDHLSGASVDTDNNGNILQLTDYYPYGNERIEETTTDFHNDYTYTGKERDEDTDLLYYEARYYNSNIARFISIDPWAGDLTDPQSLNKYAYVRNNPLKYVDPTGMKVSEYQVFSPKNGDRYELGEKMGEYRGIEIISGGNKTGTGNHPYQCTTLAKEFALSEYGVNLGGTGNGVHYGNQEKINNAFNANNKDNPGTYTVYQNSGTVMPQENDIISWSGGTYGHVGFIAEVTFEESTGNGWVYTVEQNASSSGGLFAQQFTRTYNEDGQAVYTVDSRFNGYSVSGWARYENQSKESHPEEYTSSPSTPATKQSTEDKDNDD
ncbi:CHAP domain-containing protein [Candidatus Peregrinibacteria bacterium]|nr:MAG: CHAP domain-containing protein [Candidatus Peregrinibacteria bacterium]